MNKGYVAIRKIEARSDGSWWCGLSREDFRAYVENPSNVLRMSHAAPGYLLSYTGFGAPGPKKFNAKQQTEWAA